MLSWTLRKLPVLVLLRRTFRSVNALDHGDRKQAGKAESRKYIHFECDVKPSEKNPKGCLYFHSSDAAILDYFSCSLREFDACWVQGPIHRMPLLYRMFKSQKCEGDSQALVKQRGICLKVR